MLPHFLLLRCRYFLVFFWFDLALYLGSALLLCLFASIHITIKRTKQYGSLSASLLNACRSDVIEHLQGAYELHSNGLMQQHEQSILDRLNDFYLAQTKLNSNVANIQLMLDFILGLIMLAVMISGLMAVSSGLVSGAVAIMVVMMFLGLSELLQSLPSQFSRWGTTSFSANRLTELTQTSPSKNSTTVEQIKSLDMSVFNHTKIALSKNKPLSFSLTNNQLINLQGRSGSGKSTVARLLIGAEKFNTIAANSNRIVINKQVNLHDLALEHWYSHLGYLEQKNSILAGSLGYNLALGLPSVSDDEIWQALKLVELLDWANALPQGLNTWLGESGSKISGGQARRICLARLLLRDPSLVILDEPFNGIDNKMAARIWHNILPWVNARMTILLTHERPDYFMSPTKDKTQQGTPVVEICLDENMHNT